MLQVSVHIMCISEPALKIISPEECPGRLQIFLERLKDFKIEAGEVAELFSSGGYLNIGESHSMIETPHQYESMLNALKLAFSIMKKGWNEVCEG